ncbi:hypothetical protein FH972_024568 [Carpinus fangiana]|uniref:Anaphase-promoting complex subunit 4 WD40 domain-containing protein n=1 Tax=Carpinus fangiana TaxID=176857 RepID=A0A5N6L0X2_9ROSI|nr:hypothetical protein FH972_024568 [Carpinus fangiana]
MAATGQENELQHHDERSFGLLSPPPSSPPLPPMRTKLKKPPPITPKRFTKFFSPRNLSSSMGKSGRILRDITASGINGFAPDHSTELRPLKRRKISSTLLTESPSPASEPISPLQFASSPPPSSPCPNTAIPFAHPYPHPIRKASVTWQHLPDFSHTASFYSGPEDVHNFAREHLPFCVQACNTNSLVAIGSEEGEVRIVESAQDGIPPFSEPYISFRPHENAIMNLAFSSDDHYLATASGDQTGRIVDMYTQKTLFVLDEHTCSLKQISFMPDNDKIVATCSRDGVVGLWDLRCRTSSGPSYLTSTGTIPTTTPTYVKMYNSIINAHAPLFASSTANRIQYARPSSHPATTSLSFLPPSRGGSNLFLTSCADSAQLRLWDIRGKYSSRRGTPIPVSTTAPISSHIRHRPFGVNSVSLSTDASRVFALCKDSTVYAYSTNHLLLGQAPELNTGGKLERWSKGGATGAGPLYGMRNDAFRTGSFYVRSVVRRATPEHSELLAVGSSEGAPVLFPTDEALFHARSSSGRLAGRDNDPVTGRLASLRTSHSFAAVSVIGTPGRGNDGGELPIYTMGTPLIRGHSKEVTGVTWSSNGELVSISDDFRARVWREDANKARELRTQGEGEGRRWARGWADVDEEWDEEDG